MPRNSNRSWPYDNFRKLSVDLSQTMQTAIGPPRLVGVDGRELGGLRRDVGFQSLQLSQVGLLQTQEREPTFMAGFEIQKGTGGKNLIRGFCFLDGTNVFLQYYDTESGTFPNPFFVSTTFTGDADDMDLTVRGKFIYLAGVGTGGLPLVVWHDGTNWKTEDMGPVNLDDYTPVTYSQGASGLLVDGDYVIVQRMFNPERGVFDGTSKKISITITAGGGSATIGATLATGGSASAAAQASGFTDAYLYRTVKLGTTLYLEQIVDIGTSGSQVVSLGEQTLGLTDQQLQLQDTFEPFVDPVRKPPKTNRINTFQGLTVMKLTGDDAGEQALTDLIWTKTERIAPEEFGPDNIYPGPSNIGSVIQFINAGDFLLGVTPVSTIRIQKAGIDMAIQPIHRGWGPLSRYAAVDFGPAIMIAGPRGLYFIEAASGRLQLIEAVDRLITHNDEWLLDILADQNATGAPNIQLAFDEPQGCIYILNSAKNEAICFWTKTSRVTIREDMPFTLATTASHPVTGGSRRAFFAGIATGGTPAFVQSDRVFFPDAFREGPPTTPTFESSNMQTMHGALDPGTKVNGVATGGTAISLTDTGNLFTESVFGAFIHIWQTVGGVETRIRRFMVPAPAFVLDDFNRTNSSSLGPNWVQTGSGTSNYWNPDYWSTDYWSTDYWSQSTAFAITINSNKALSTNIGSSEVEYAAIWDTAIPSDDYDVQAEFVANSGALPWFQLHGRRVTKTEANPEGYLMTAATKTVLIEGRTLTANNVYLEYVSPLGVETEIGSVPFTFVSGTTYLLKLSLRSNVLIAYVDGKEVLRRVLDEQAIIAGAQFEKDALASAHMSMDRVDSTRVCVAYQESDFKMYARIATVSGSDVTWGAKLQITTGGFYTDVAVVDTDTVLVVYYDFADTGKGKVTKLVLDGATLSINATLIYAASVDTTEGARFNRISKMDSGTYVISWIDWEKAGGVEKKIVRSVIMIVVGGIPSMLAPTDITSTSTPDLGVNVVGLDGTTFVVAYIDSVDGNKGKLKVCSHVDGVITQGTAITFHGSSGGVQPGNIFSATKWSSTELVIAYHAVLEQETRAVLVTVTGLDATIGATPASSKFSDSGDWIDLTTLSQDSLTFGVNSEWSPGIANSVDGMKAVAKLSANKVIIAYQRVGLGYVIVGDVTGSTVSYGVEIGTFGATPRGMAFAVMSSSTVILSWMESTTKVFAVTVTVTGLDATFDTPTVDGAIETAINGIQTMDIYSVDSTRAIITWKTTASAVKAKVLTITGTTITIGVVAAINSPAGNPVEGTKIVMLDSTRWLIAMSNSGGPEVIVQTGTVSGSTISVGASTTISSGVNPPEFLSLAKLTTATAVLTFRAVDLNDNFGRATILTVSGVDVTAGATHTFEHITESILEGLDVVALSATSIAVVWVDLGNADSLNSKVGTVSGTTITFQEKVTFFEDVTNDGVDRPVYAVMLDSTKFIAIAQSGLDNSGLSFIGTPTGLSSQRLLIVYRDFAADRFGKARVGDVSGGVITWVEPSQFLFPTTPAQILANSADARSNNVAMLDYDTGFVFTRDFGDGNKGKGILLEIPTLGNAQILLNGAFAGFGIAFDTGSETASTDDFRIIEEKTTIGLTPALTQAVASGDRYSIAPIPFRVTLPALSSEGVVDHFRRTIVESMKGLIANYTPNQVTTVNEKMRFQVFRNGNQVEHAGIEVNLDADQDDFVASFGGVSGHVLHPGMESFASNSDMELIAVRVEGGVTDSDIDQ